jgi:protein-tyrosine phosphatase
MLAMGEHEQRLVALEGASNFRDLGGYRSANGKTVRWGRLYRSDHLGALTPGDVRVLRQRQVSVALDFRGVHESAAASYEHQGLQRVALSIEPTVATRMRDLVAEGRFLDEAVTVELMEDLYRGIVRTQASRLSAFFRHLLQAEQALVFHCTAGKDRTGIAAALFLESLGVSRQEVMQDFLLTNAVYRAPQMTLEHGSAEAARALWSVKPQYLEAAWAVLDTEFGGVQRYIRDVLRLEGADVQALENGYLSAA